MIPGISAPITQAGAPLGLMGGQADQTNVFLSAVAQGTGAERPETLDLMRRHIEQLETEFRQLGYDNIGFEFSGGDAQSSDQSENSQHSISPDMADSVETHPTTQALIPTNGVDIRL